MGFWLAGKGSYGAVYKARDIRTSELVAIKVISLSEGVRMIFLFVFDIHGIGWMNHYGMNLLAFFFCLQEEGYEEIRGEIEMLQQCSHPNVVRYLGSYQGEEYLWVGALSMFLHLIFVQNSLS